MSCCIQPPADAWATCEDPRCPTHGGVEAALSHPCYEDSKGRRWHHSEFYGAWFHGRHHFTLAQMRRFVRTDLHKCRGLLWCMSHPVPMVVVGPSRDRTWMAYPAHGGKGKAYPTLAAAFAAAEKLGEPK